MLRLLQSERAKTTVAVIGVLAVSAMPAFAADIDRLGAHFAAGGSRSWARRSPSAREARSPTGPFVPVVGPIDYGTAENAFGAARSGHVHAGQDMFAPAGTPEVAATDGVIAEAGSDGGQGNYVYLYDPKRDRTYVYMHMIAPAVVKPGERVDAGEKLGGLGCTGSCWGDHLHFEIRDGKGIEGDPTDPLPYLRDWQHLDEPLTASPERPGRSASPYGSSGILIGRWTGSATSRSSPTSTTASRRLPTASSRSPGRSTRASTCRSCSTRWTSSASEGSRSRPRPCGSTTPPADGETYHLHLIDTPGHVDFSYEVSRSLAACEGALLVVDAAQGVEAQTVANTYAAIEAGLELVPVLNKVDLPSAEPERVTAEIVDLIGCDPDDVLRISAKTGEGVERRARGDRRADPAARGRAGGAAAGADLRLRVRPVPRRGRLPADGRRRVSRRARRSGRCRPAPRPRSTRSASSPRR